MIVADHIFNILVGEWSINRDIPSIGFYRGVVFIKSLSPNKLEYNETGLLKTNNGQSIEGYRSFLYCLENQTIIVYFNDGPNKGKQYCELSFSDDSSGLASDIHYCGDDEYKVKFEYISDNQFHIQTNINGPNKDSVLNTIYYRQ